ncbi:hypothetical protein CPB86DRAFT_800146 [Serendipita vermifera]|nr:hypothetical protein CPB86DRAFT_800146 [Serendipita vermifera]
MSSLEHQNRPSSAIFLGHSSPAGQDAVLLQTSFSTPTTPLTAAIHVGRLAQLPSPPHTNSTSGSTGDKDSANAGSVRRSGAPLLAVHDEESSVAARMQNGNDFDNEDDDDDLTRRQGLDIQDPANKHRITPKIERARSLANKTHEILTRLDKYGGLMHGRSSSTMSPLSRTVSLTSATGATATNSPSTRHSSLSLPRRRDVFDQDADVPAGQSTASNSDTGDDRSQTPPAGTPHKRLLELSPNPRQRLVSEPTTPNRHSLLRNGTNTSGSLLRRGHTPRGELMTVEEGEGRSPANGSAKKSRTPIPLEFLNADPNPSAHVDDSDPNAGALLTLPRAPSRSRQPSPGLYSSPGSPSLATSSGTLGGPDSKTSRRPRPPGLRNSYDRWGESYEKWEKTQMEQQENSPADTDSSMQQQQRRGLRSVVNESLKAAGLTPTSATSATSSMRRRPEEEGTRPRKLSSGVLGRDVFANSPISSLRERNWESMDLTRAGNSRSSTERERPRSRISPEDQDSRSDMDSLRERAARHPFFSPNVRPTRTIHNVLQHPEESASTNGVDTADGRETPANLRIFKSNYSSQFASSPMMKSYTSPSGTQRTLPPRAATVANLSTGSPKVGMNGSPLSAVPSSGNLSTSGGPVQLLQDSLFMFESHVQRLPQGSAMPDTFNDVLRDAKGIVHAASALNIALRSAATVCVDEQIDAEVAAQAENTTKEGHPASEVAEVWRKVGAEFREDVRVSDELVRALTSFMIGTGRMLRSATSTANANHSRMKSIGDASSTVGSISRAGGKSLSRGTSLVRGVGGGSSDGRRSVEGWSMGVGLSAMDRRSVDGRKSTDGRRSVEPIPYGGNRHSADEHREESMRRLTARQGAPEVGDTGSNGSGGSRDRPSTGTAHRLSYQAAGSGNESRATSALGVPRLSHDETTPRTFTSLSSKRSSGMPTPASATQKALPKLPLPPPEVAFPQTQDGGDRTPIELARPHTRHSTMPPLAVPPPLPTLPSESLLQRNRTIGKHAASNSITSASTSSTTKPHLTSSHATVRGSAILPAPSSTEATTAVTPTTARPRQTSFGSAASNPLSLGRARGSAAVSGLQQVALSNPPRRRTTSASDNEAVVSSKTDPNPLAITQSISSLSSNTTSKASSGALSSPGGRKSSISSAGSPLESRKSTLRPTANRRTSSMLSGGSSSTVTSPTSGAQSDTARSRVVSRMSSAGTLGSPAINNTSRSSLVSGTGANSTDSTGEEERRLRRSRVRMSLNAMMDKRGGIGELLGGRKLGSGGRLAGHDAEHEDGSNVGDSPSLSAKERLTRRRAADPLLS